MSNKMFSFLAAVVCAAGVSMSVCRAEAGPSRVETCLKDGWRFHRGEADGAFVPGYDDSGWESVSVPHDWAITGPFSIENDLQNVQIVQNMETKASLKTGRTGGLPYVGVGWYRTEFNVPEGMKAELLFDGAMSEARVYVNGHEVCFWPYGYSPFHCDVTPYLDKSGSNVLAVRLENLPFSSRWYPGAGLYRNVHLVCTSAKAHIPVWGTFVSTPSVHKDMASVSLAISLQSDKENIDIEYATDVFSPDGEKVASRRSVALYHNGDSHVQKFLVKEPKLWSPEHPYLYKALTRILVDGVVTDEYETRFGIRSVEFIPEKGFYLNGEHRKFKGVCNHHDLGPLGAAVSVPALRHQLTMLKDMGCDAVRTSHNTPAPELVSLCDEMGFMMMVEPFDEWDDAKCRNGYHRYFDEWAERDMISMLHAFRNSPSVIMWSIGNEVPSQCTADGYKTAAFLQSICHREDPTRPVTCGMDQVNCVLSNGFAAQLDIPGINYRTFRYKDCYEQLPQSLVLGSETASTVSSRGTYHFPVEKAFSVKHEDHQSSGYDMEACNWSNIPDVDFALAEDYPWTLGQFVWTGFDYLGEPSPYDTDSWPNHSSMFGIIDLASIPKDRYWLYRSVWNMESPTLHIVPHWTWPGREGQVTPVYCYTSYPSAELFVNGVSQGRRTRNAASRLDRYRLRWNEVVYQPGELKVVAYAADGKVAAEEVVKTAGAPHRLAVTLDRATLARTVDGTTPDLAFATVRVVDAHGTPCPDAALPLTFRATGAVAFKAACNGDATSLEPFTKPAMRTFHGALVVVVEAGPEAGTGRLAVSADGLAEAVAELTVAP